MYPFFKKTKQNSAWACAETGDAFVSLVFVFLLAS